MAMSSPAELPLHIRSDDGLIKRILLTDPDELTELTISGTPRKASLSFSDFQNSLENRSDVSMTIKAAIRDEIVESGDWKRVKGLLEELHAHICELVPSRKDLHAAFTEKASRLETASESEVHDLILVLSRALAQLESPARSESTLAWAKSHDRPTEVSVTTCVEAILYLLYKTETCQSDKQDFFLQTIWAPQLHERGIDLLRERWKLDAHQCPTTRQWVQRLTVNSGETAKTTPDEKTQFVLTGWIELIFATETLPLSEVFAHFMRELRRIRHLTRLVASSSALFIHACQMSGQSTSIMNSPEHVESIKTVESTLRTPVEPYNLSVAQALSRFMDQIGGSTNSSLDDIIGRVDSVLQGNDPVLVVLNKRIRQSFGEISSWSLKTERLRSLSAKSGRVATSSGTSWASERADYFKRAEVYLHAQGLSCVHDLAVAARLAAGVAEIVAAVHMDSLELMFSGN